MKVGDELSEFHAETIRSIAHGKATADREGGGGLKELATNGGLETSIHEANELHDPVTIRIVDAHEKERVEEVAPLIKIGKEGHIRALVRFSRTLWERLKSLMTSEFVEIVVHLVAVGTGADDASKTRMK